MNCSDTDGNKQRALSYTHKVLTYIEYRLCLAPFKLLTPHALSTHECVLPPHQRRGVHTTHSPGGEGVGGQYFRKTPDIGLASYSIIPLRVYCTIGKATISERIHNNKSINFKCWRLPLWWRCLRPVLPGEAQSGQHSSCNQYWLYICIV